MPAAQSAIDPQINDKIRQEEAANSQVMRTLHYLADVYGPRVTGSPSHKAAAEWAVKTMTGWGMVNGHLEPWDWGKPGWANEHLAVHAVVAVQGCARRRGAGVDAGHQRHGQGEGVQSGRARRAARESRRRPDRDGTRRPRSGATLSDRSRTDRVSRFDQGQGQGRRRAGRQAGLRRRQPRRRRPGRQTDEQVRCRYDENAANDPACAATRDGADAAAGRRTRAAARRSHRLTAAPDRRAASTRSSSLNKAAFRINDAGRAHGQIVAFNNSTYDVTKAVPTVVMRNEDYGRIARILADGTPVELEATIVNKTYPAGPSYNAIAEIAGTDKAAEVVMAGGHLDSWHSATGATDNAIGCAIMMEAARILKAIGVQPRRTIRIALWSGEEQGLLGSLAYVKAHFGSAEEPTPEFAKFNGYLNIDTGTGRLRGASVFGPPEGGEDPGRHPRAVQGSEDRRRDGRREPRHRRHRQHVVQQRRPAGHRVQPGLDRVQQPHAPHQPRHLRARIEQDVRDAAVIVAATLYQLAMQDQPLPRFAPDKMPAPPPPRGGGQWW